MFGRFVLRHGLFSLGYYGANAIYQGYMSLYYTGLGFHSVQLGGISAATALAALGAQPIWGMLGDRARSRKRLLGALALLSAAALPLALLGGGFWFQLAAAMLFYAFFCALLPLNDAILLEAQGGAFGGYRLAGGAKFMVRPSGTEPKIKTYLSAVAPVEADADGQIAAMKAAAENMMR